MTRRDRPMRDAARDQAWRWHMFHLCSIFPGWRIANRITCPAGRVAVAAPPVPGAQTPVAAVAAPPVPGQSETVVAVAAPPAPGQGQTAVAVASPPAPSARAAFAGGPTATERLEAAAADAAAVLAEALALIERTL